MKMFALLISLDVRSDAVGVDLMIRISRKRWIKEQTCIGEPAKEIGESTNCANGGAYA